VPPALRRAVSARDAGCRFPGCTHHRWTDAHHIRHWAHGGETSAANLVSLCRGHHRLVHEGGFRVDRGADGEPRFWRPDGSLIERSPALRPRRRSPAHGGRRRIAPLQPAGGTVVPLSRGDRMDLDLSVMLLAGRTVNSARGP
jgi:hypothetical protein